MKRDMDLIRGLLLRFEDHDRARLSRKELQLEGYSQEQIDPHIERQNEAGPANHQVVRPQYSSGHQSMIRFDLGIRTTKAGYGFLESVRDPDIWRKAKDGALKAGGWTVELLIGLGKGLLKKQIEERTGVKL
ncbi:DUF2513 domain-containing protein [Microvirga sp. TS319]|uniref:DUF2513 domain-containing protein n=1 Tax=Microvirga sp. TS319 TaxID=3241165 RepID=UPI00351A694F